MGRIARLFGGRRDRVTAKGLDERTQFRAYVRLKSGGTISAATLDRYEQAVFHGTRNVVGLLPWLEGQRIDAETVAAYHETVLLKKYKANSRVPICSGLNWYLRWKRIRDDDGEDLRFPIPAKEAFHRRWILEILRRVCRATVLAEDITPRTFRRTLATNWKGDVKDLQAQGGWADTKTIFKHYRLLDEERHLDGFEKTFGLKVKP